MFVRLYDPFLFANLVAVCSNTLYIKCTQVNNFFIFIFSLVNQTMSTLDVGQVRRVLTEALDVWARSSPLTFQEVYSDEADIQVLFAK